MKTKRTAVAWVETWWATVHGADGQPIGKPVGPFRCEAKRHGETMVSADERFAFARHVVIDTRGEPYDGVRWVA